MADTPARPAARKTEKPDRRLRVIRQMILLAFMLLVVLLLLLPALVEDGLSDRRSRPVIDRVLNAVSDVPGVRGVVTAEIVASDDDVMPTLRVVYLTAEMDEIGYRAEIVEVNRAIGEALLGTDTQFAQVVVVPSVRADEPIEIISAPGQKLRALQAEDITRTDFLAELEVESLKGLGGHGDPATDV